MVGDELPCHENLFIQQLEGGALDPGQDDFMGRGPLEASVKIWFCQLCVSTGSILENLWGRFFFIHTKTVWCLLASFITLTFVNNRSKVKAILPDCSHYQNYIALLCIYRANVNGHLSPRAQTSLWTRESCGATALSNLKQMCTNSCNRKWGCAQVPSHYNS